MTTAAARDWLQRLLATFVKIVVAIQEVVTHGKQNGDL